MSVNAYGSFVDPNEDDLETSSSSGESSCDTEVEDRDYCDCKGKCFRKKGKGVCKCRASGLSCHENCSCNKAQCRNIKNDSGQGQAPRAAAIHDGDVALQQERQQSQQEILDFVANLEDSTKDRILVNLLNMGRGSLDFAKSLANDTEEQEESNLDIDKPEWCKCGVCVVMPTEQENLCCKRVTCLTCYTAFANICLDRDVLEICIKARCDIRAEDFNFTMESFRKAGYRQFALWRYGKLGRDNRRVLPACAVRRIRERYPAPDGNYMGFRLH